jgi:hypothetical protein
MNGVPVSFSLLAGSGGARINVLEPTTGSFKVTGATDNVYYDGLAGAELTLDSSFAGDCSVAVSLQSQPGISVRFDVHCVSDTEVPTLGVGLNLWETRCDPDSLIHGDGLWGGNDPDSENLDLLVELEYDPQSFPDLSNITEACDSVRSIYNTIGVKCTFAISQCDSPVTSPFNNHEEMKGTLAHYRDTSQTGLGRGALHAMLLRGRQWRAREDYPL